MASERTLYFPSRESPLRPGRCRVPDFPFQSTAPPPPPPPPPPTPGMMMQLQPPLMTEERVPGEELEGIACMQSLAEEPEPPRHAEPSPAVLKALELAAARRSTERAVLPTPAHPNAFMTPAAPVKGGKLGADENQNQLQSA